MPAAIPLIVGAVTGAAWGATVGEIAAIASPPLQDARPRRQVQPTAASSGHIDQEPMPAQPADADGS